MSEVYFLSGINYVKLKINVDVKFNKSRMYVDFEFFILKLFNYVNNNGISIFYILIDIIIYYVITSYICKKKNIRFYT